MTTQTILEQAGIPLLLFVICMYYGLKLMILQDVSTIRGKNKEPVKDEKAYAKKGGALILFFGFATLVMTSSFCGSLCRTGTDCNLYDYFWRFVEKNE